MKEKILSAILIGLFMFIGIPLLLNGCSFTEDGNSYTRHLQEKAYSKGNLSSLQSIYLRDIVIELRRLNENLESLKR